MASFLSSQDFQNFWEKGRKRVWEHWSKQNQKGIFRSIFLSGVYSMHFGNLSVSPGDKKKLDN